MQALNTTMIGRSKHAAAEVARKARCDAEFGRITDFATRTLNADASRVIFASERKFCSENLGFCAENLGSGGENLGLSRACDAVMASDALTAVPDMSSDGRFRSARSGDVAGFLGVPVHGPDGAPMAVLCVTTAAPRIWSREDQEMLTFLGSEIDVTMRMREATKAEARRADEQSLVAREYHHRIRNAFSVSSAIVVLSGAKDGSVQELVEATSAQLSALADAHTSLGFEQEDVSLEALVESALRPYKSSGATVTAHGSDVTVDADKVVSLSLIFTELATNSTKHGALGKGGSVDVTWSVRGGEVALRWCECSPELRTAPIKREGSFGGTMVEIAVSQLGAELDREWLSDGLEVTLTFPA